MNPFGYYIKKSIIPKTLVPASLQQFRADNSFKNDKQDKWYFGVQNIDYSELVDRLKHDRVNLQDKLTDESIFGVQDSNWSSSSIDIP